MGEHSRQNRSRVPGGRGTSDIGKRRVMLVSLDWSRGCSRENSEKESQKGRLRTDVERCERQAGLDFRLSATGVFFVQGKSRLRAAFWQQCRDPNCRERRGPASGISQLQEAHDLWYCRKRRLIHRSPEFSPSETS